MKLTKRKALTICWELWTWLSENPGKYKKDWPGWDKYGSMKNNCPCCEYTDTNCKACPLIKFWHKSTPSKLKGYCAPCVDGAYGRRHSIGNDVAGKQIANAAKEELDKLPPLKENKNG